jgi:hypothetical protein
MSENYNPDSIDAVLARFEAKFDDHVANTAQFRRELKETIAAHGRRLDTLEGDRAKLLGAVIGGGLGAGGLGAAVHRLFGP